MNANKKNSAVNKITSDEVLNKEELDLFCEEYDRIREDKATGDFLEWKNIMLV